MTDDKKDHVPNDHGILGEQAKKEKDDVAATDPDLKTASTTEGLNEARSAGSAGAYEGFENQDDDHKS